MTGRGIFRKLGRVLEGKISKDMDRPHVQASGGFVEQSPGLKDSCVNQELIDCRNQPESETPWRTFSPESSSCGFQVFYLLIFVFILCYLFILLFQSVFFFFEV